MLQFLQRIGKAVMLPIAALPIAGILLGVGGAFLGIAGLENAPAIYQPLLAFISIPAVHAVLTVMKNGKLDSVPLEEVVGNNTKIGAVSGNTPESNLRKVTMDDDLVKTARHIGICLGD